MAKIEVKYKWQKAFVEEIEQLSFEEKIDELVNITCIGDRMDNRDLWEMDYLTDHLKKNYGT